MWDIDMGHIMQSLRFHSSHGEGKTRDQEWRYLVDRAVRDIGNIVCAVMFVQSPPNRNRNASGGGGGLRQSSQVLSQSTHHPH